MTRTLTSAGTGVDRLPCPGRRPAPPGPLAASAVFGWRALLKIRHVPEQLFDVIAIPVVFTLMFTYLFGGAWPARPAGTWLSSCPAPSRWPSCWSACTPGSG